ncbi:hypothetical protein ACFVQ0_09930 [Streptomyces sp. NPDC057900]|uniref:hypothetical protein n=1 Tax=Streptomyces sp. NPDC057900 TaxID=3346274 RepID=UPI0036EBD2B9
MGNSVLYVRAGGAAFVSALNAVAVVAGAVAVVVARVVVLLVRGPRRVRPASGSPVPEAARVA